MATPLYILTSNGCGFHFSTSPPTLAIFHLLLLSVRCLPSPSAAASRRGFDLLLFNDIEYLFTYMSSLGKCLIVFNWVVFFVVEL